MIETKDDRGVIHLDISEIVNDYGQYLKEAGIYNEEDEKTYLISGNVFEELFEQMVAQMKGNYNLKKIDLPESFMVNLKENLKHLFEIQD